MGKLIKAAKEVATAATGSESEAVGTVVADAAAGVANADSVKGIAKGIKAIVDAVGGAAKLTAAAANGEDNKDAGKLFTGKNKGGEAKDASKAAGAVSAVSGEQIIKAIVDAAGKGDGEQGGEKAGEAENPIAAAIGKDDDEAKAFGKEGMKKDDQIAAAIALRGMAKNGKFAVKNAAEKDDAKGAVKSAAESVAALIGKLIAAAKEVETAATGATSEAVGTVVKATAGAGAGVADKDSVKGIAKGIKAIVEAVGGDAKLAAVAAKEDNINAGKLFTGKKDKGGEAKDASKAAGAVSAVSGEQIIKAIVDAAGKADQEGKKAGEAENPIQAAIGAADEDEKAFGDNKMKKDDQIAAAIALRGMAKDGKFAVKNDDKDKAEGAVKSAAESVAALIEKLITAAKEVADAANGSEAVGNVVKAAAAGSEAVGTVVKANGAGAADKDSVKGIAKGIKAIVEAVGGDAKLTAAAANGEDNKDAGKLFAGKNGADKGGDEKDASKAAGAVSAVSGEQIIKAIVAAAGKSEQDGQKAGDATNPIQAAIGKANEDAAAFGNEGMKKDDQIAAAIALRGMAKNGKFAVKNDEADAKGAVKSAAESVAALIEKLITAAKAVEAAANGTASEAVGTVVKADDAAGAGAADAGSVNGIAKGIKAIVDAVGGAAKLTAAAAKEDNINAGKLFFGKDANNGGEAKDASKAAGAVSAVSGEQIIKAIVDAAGKSEQDGKKASDATNPIAAAIGAADDNAEAFEKEMKKDDQIAAAIALRGMAKDGKFAVKDDEADDAKGAVKSAAESVAALIEKLITAAKEVEAAANGGAESEAVGNVVKATANAGAGAADAGSVKGIAKGIKAIVDAVGGAEKLKAAGDANGEDNGDAGKLFTGKKDKGGEAKDASKAAGAVSAVSGEQIIKAIVAAAGKADGEQGGAKASEAKNPIAAAIGEANEDAEAFDKDEMKKDDQIAAAIALRGMAKDGKFAVKDDAAGNGKGAVKSAAESAVELIGKLITAAKAVADAATGTESEAVGTVVKAKDDAAGAGVADKDSVNGIAKGIKAIVEAVGGGEKLTAADAKEDNINAGKLFTGKNKGGDAKDASKAAGAVSAVSGEQIIKAIVAAAGKGDKDQEGKKAEDATNPIAAAIGEDNEDEKAFEKMKKDDQIAAAIALRGMAKDGKFAVKDAEKDKAEGAVKSAAESAVKEVSELIGKLITCC
ncbi:variable large family protein [Borreliella afzelii]|uniref:variable large family protein n=1 Tax=Borreliella afzelii TaxID=29518 RepID=UPI00157571B7